MNELILYNLSSSKILIIVFLVTFFIIGLFLYWLVNRLRLEKGKIKIHGLLLGINDKGIIILSMTLVRAFLIIFYTLVHQNNIQISLIMIGVISIIYILCSARNIIYEIVNTGAILAVIYFINTLNTYLIEITYSSSVEVVKIILISFIVMYTIYLLLKSIEEIIENDCNIIE